MLQPVVQVCASFPANFLFPMVMAVFIAWHIPLNIGGIVLMALGTQWYILFNVIAGAGAIPNDLLEASRDMRLPRVLRWRYVLLPGIFASFVTGGITAAGGAWNAPSSPNSSVTTGPTTMPTDWATTSPNRPHRRRRDTPRCCCWASS